MEMVIFCKKCKDRVVDDGHKLCNLCEQELAHKSVRNHYLAKKKGKRLLVIAKRTRKAFVGGFEKQCMDGGTLGTAAACGIYQGLKYKGSIKRGVATTGIVLVAMAAFNGVANIFRNKEYILQEDDRIV